MHYSLRNKEDWGSFQTLAAKMQGTKKNVQYHRFFRIIDENNPGENNKETSKKR